MAATGLQSPSGALTVTGIIAGVLSAVEGVLTPGTTAHTAVYGGGGIILGLGSVIGKLFHDKGIHVATIQQAGSDIAAQLPSLKADIAKTISFAETDLPGVKSAVDAVTSRVTALETKVPDLAGIESTVRTVLASVLTPPAPPTPAPPAAG